MASKEEAKRLTANINQISASLDSQVAPTVIEFEGKTLKFEGTIESQFKNWKAYLNDYFEEQNKINKEIEVLFHMFSRPVVFTAVGLSNPSLVSISRKYI